VLYAALGLVRVAKRDTPGRAESTARIDAVLERLQNELFNLGSDLATLPAHRHPLQPVIEPRQVEALEALIDDLNQGLPELTSFVLPGGGPVGAALHLARTICRRAERSVVALAHEEEVEELFLIYLNRLSDLLFTLARLANHRDGKGDVTW
jgi:cob(I)alamin adenosyltransferase